MHKASLLFIFEPYPGLESSMSTLRSGPRLQIKSHRKTVTAIT